MGFDSTNCKFCYDLFVFVFRVRIHDPYKMAYVFSECSRSMQRSLFFFFFFFFCVQNALPLAYLDFRGKYIAQIFANGHL